VESIHFLEKTIPVGNAFKELVYIYPEILIN